MALKKKRQPPSRIGSSVHSRAAKKAGFLAAFAFTGNLSLAAERSGVSRNLHYDWLRDDTDYQLAFADAQKMAVEQLEAEARRRAVEGCRRLKFHQGEVIQVPTGKTITVQEKNDLGEIFETEKPEMEFYTEHEYSDTLLIFLLKGAAPQKYREKVEDRVQVDVIFKGYASFNPSAHFGSEARAEGLPTGGERDNPLGI